MRYHICWGGWHGPHTTDLPLKDIVGLLLQIRVGAYLIEAANARHEHEWRVWEEVKLPPEKILIPGVVSHATNVVEHPELVAERITRFATVVGRENVDRRHRLRPRRPASSPARLGKAKVIIGRRAPGDQTALGPRVTNGNCLNRSSRSSAALRSKRLIRDASKCGLAALKKTTSEHLGQRIQATPVCHFDRREKSFLVFPIARDKRNVGRYLARIILRPHFDG